MKRFIALLAVLALAGCATTNAPASIYRAAGQIDAWQIGGEYAISNNGIKIIINGETVINDAFGIFVTGPKTFTGIYKGKPIMAECEYRAGYQAYMQCMVFVESERAATLRF